AVSAAADAAALVISAEVPTAAIRAALTAGSYGLRVLNLAPAPPEAAGIVAAGVDWLVVNESEATAVLGRPVAGLAGAAAATGPGTQAGMPRPADVRAATGHSWPAAVG